MKNTASSKQNDKLSKWMRAFAWILLYFFYILAWCNNSGPDIQKSLSLSVRSIVCREWHYQLFACYLSLVRVYLYWFFQSKKKFALLVSIRQICTGMSGVIISVAENLPLWSLLFDVLQHRKHSIPNRLLLLPGWLQVVWARSSFFLSKFLRKFSEKKKEKNRTEWNTNQKNCFAIDMGKRKENWKLKIK